MQITDQQKALKRDFIYNMLYSSRKKGLRHLFIFTINDLTQIFQPDWLNFCVLQQYFEVKRQRRSLLRGHGISINFVPLLIKSK